MKNNYKTPDLLPQKPLRRDRSVQYGEALTSKLMYDSLFSCVVMIREVDTFNRTFSGDIYPAKRIMLVNDNAVNKESLVSPESVISKGYGIVPESIDIKSLILHQTLAVCIALDFDIRKVYDQAVIAKRYGGSSTSEFTNRMKVEVENKTADKNQNLILISKLIDL